MLRHEFRYIKVTVTVDCVSPPACQQIKAAKARARSEILILLSSLKYSVAIDAGKRPELYQRIGQAIETAAGPNTVKQVNVVEYAVQ